MKRASGLHMIHHVDRLRSGDRNALLTPSPTTPVALSPLPCVPQRQSWPVSQRGIGLIRPRTAVLTLRWNRAQHRPRPHMHATACEISGKCLQPWVQCGTDAAV